jgi:hypothetical protein
MVTLIIKATITGHGGRSGLHPWQLVDPGLGVVYRDDRTATDLPSPEAPAPDLSVHGG